MDEKLYKEVYADLKKKNIAKISYDKYMDKMVVRNEALKKKEYEERNSRKY